MKAVLAAVTVLLATTAFTACPPQPQPPRPLIDGGPDATLDGATDDGGADVVDSAPPAPVDAGPFTLACRNACVALTAAGCPHGDLLYCAAVFTRILADGKIGNPQTGASLTCDDIAKVRTKIDAMGLGFKCP